MTEKKIRQLAAIMFTDMVGYTALMQENEKKAKQNRDRHRQVLEKSIQDHHGLILQYYGDGTLSVFGSAIEAVECAIEIQKALQTDPAIPLRIGMHVGDIVYDDDGVFGDSVNISSRIEALAIPGAILISDRVYDDIKNQPHLTAKSFGEHKLKNVNRAIGIYAINCEGLRIPSFEDIWEKTGGKLQSVAVLPFTNMSTDAENEFFSDGISEEIINALTKLEGLHVTSRTSAFAFKGKNEDVRKIGSKLQVNSVLEGSVRKVGNRVRVTAQLINAKDGYHIFSEVYDRNLEDIFEVQDDISRKIADKLRAELSLGMVKEPLVKSYTDNLEAYNLYLKGLFFFNKWTPESVSQGIKHFEESIKLDPDFPLPYSGIAWCYSFLGGMGQLAPNIVFPKAKTYSQKALQLDENLAEAHLSNAMVYFFYEWNWKAAQASFDRALKLNPGSADIHNIYALYLTSAGKKEEALKEIEKAHKLDPLSLPVNMNLGEIYLIVRRYDDAIRQLDKTLMLDKNFRSALEAKGWAYLFKGDVNRAIETFLAYHKQVNHPLKGVAGLGHAYAVAGKIDEANKCLEALREREKTEKEAMLTMDFAVIYMGLKDYDKVFYYLQKSLEEKVGLMFLRGHPGWDELRKFPQYHELMKKIGFNE